MRFIAAVVLLFVGLAHAQNQLLLIERSWSASPTTESSDCVEVRTDGSYRFEHTPVDAGQPGTTKIHLGTLTSEESTQLTEILNDPAVVSLSRPASGKGLVSGGEVWRISISRGDHQQLLAFANSPRGSYELSFRGGMTSIYKTLAMKPLLEWYQQLTKRKDDIAKAATPTCSLNVRSR
jgi:hypothetical protein